MLVSFRVVGVKAVELLKEIMARFVSQFCKLRGNTLKGLEKATFALLTVLLLISSGPAYSTEEQELENEIRRIASIPDKEKQLDELKKLAQRLDANRKVENLDSKWSISTSTSPIDDTKSVVMALPAESSIRAWPNKRAIPQLVLRYKESQLEAYLDLGVSPAIESGDLRTVTLRFDSNEAFDVRGSESTDGNAIFLPNTRSIIRRVSESRTMVLRFTPFNSNPVTTTFDLSGFNTSSQELLASAGFDLNDINQIFQDYYREALKDYSFAQTYKIGVTGNLITISTQGNSWRPFARNSSVIDLISTALVGVKKALTRIEGKVELNIAVFGTDVKERISRDGALPFSPDELKGLTEQALKKAQLPNDVVVNYSVGAASPEYYGNDAPQILVGKLQDTNERVEVKVNFL